MGGNEECVCACVCGCRFRISLAATTLLYVGEKGEFAVEWMNKRSHLQDKGCSIA